jgi:hypothetical protein
MTETTEADYAAAVVRVLRAHFPALDAETSHLAVDAITRQAASPQPGFEFIVDDPISARWRLKSKPGRDQGRVRLRFYRTNRRPADDDLEDAVNAALEALEA